MEGTYLYLFCGPLSLFRSFRDGSHFVLWHVLTAAMSWLLPMALFQNSKCDHWPKMFSEPCTTEERKFSHLYPTPRTQTCVCYAPMRSDKSIKMKDSRLECFRHVACHTFWITTQSSVLQKESWVHLKSATVISSSIL